MLQHLVAICSRLLSLIILPAQLPGDVVDLIDDLARAPVSTVLSWPPKVVLGLVRQFVRLEKLTIEQDTALEQMTSIRRRYLQRGWAPCPVRTSDGVLIDAVIKEPPPTADGATGGSTGPELAPRYIIFVGGNFQKYELWLSYYEVYARDVGCGFFAFNFRGVGHSEGAVTAAADLVTDVAACVDALLLRGVLPQHLVRRATAEPTNTRERPPAHTHARSPLSDCDDFSSPSPSTDTLRAAPLYAPAVRSCCTASPSAAPSRRSTSPRRRARPTPPSATPPTDRSVRRMRMLMLWSSDPSTIIR